ncbi:MAG: DNA polymerase Y family protein [Rhodobacteraceae bacterium]|nr:DNA polymerase Y family protein [Paracoccaceae bacterium]
MPARRILALWFPRLAAERALRAEGAALLSLPFAVVAEEGGRQRLAALTAEAEAAGLVPGQSLGDARAVCPALVTRPAHPPAERAFLAALARWAGRFSPWVAEAPPDGLVVDLTGCAHLFGGEAALLAAVEADCAAFGLSLRAAVADTPGAAWALARFAARPEGGAGPLPGGPTGDAIDQEARATRARAARRHPARPARPAGPPPLRAPGPAPAGPAGPAGRIAPPGHTRSALAPLPVAALRLDPEIAAGLARLGIARIGDLAGLPRAALARRFGQGLMRRLDQALGIEPEPVSPARAAPRFAVRLSFPEPIGRAEDVAAGLARMLPVLSGRLAAAGRGARRVRIEAWGSDGTVQGVEAGFARPAAGPEALAAVLCLRAEAIDPGGGLDRLRLEATVTEPVHARAHRGHLDAAADARGRAGGEATALADLIGRIGARIGLDAVTRLHPGASHIPEKAAVVMAAAWSEPAPGWPPRPGPPRPLVLFAPPEPVAAPEGPAPPAAFRWRRRAFRTRAATGPERIAPEWWLDAPAWRSGPRDYWRIETEEGERLWLFFAHGGTVTGGWFCHGAFA